MLYAKMYVEGEPWDFFILRRYEDRDGGDNLAVRVERGSDSDAFSEWRLPDVSCQKSFGFSEDEIFAIENYLKNNESIMWDDFREWQRDEKRAVV